MGAAACGMMDIRVTRRRRGYLDVTQVWSPRHRLWPDLDAKGKMFE